VHTVYRLGDRYCARLPLTPAGAAELASESRWLPRLAARLTLGVAEPVGLGRPTPAYPSGWAVYRWIAGRPYAEELVDDEAAAAAALADFVRELRAIDPVGAAPAGRRPLAELDAGRPEVDRRRRPAHHRPGGRRDRRPLRMTGQEGCARCIRTRSTPAASVVRPTTR
jgi:aminoglycoside phosphotransferase (APT) family kinase protein